MGRQRRSEPAAPESGSGREPQPAERPGRRNRAPVRTGLLGVSTAVAVGVVTVTSGLLPGGGGYVFGGAQEPAAPVWTGSPAAPEPREAATTDAAAPGGAAAGPGAGPTRPPATGASPGAGEPSSAPSPRRTAGDPTASPGNGTAPSRRSSRGAPAEAESLRTSAPGAGPERAAEARVLVLVNRERREAGCSPVTADPVLADLARAFSRDMAERDFFAHTDPDGTTPWDRAGRLGIEGLGGENIARGQTTAEAVMEAWLDTPRHRANILNCDYRTLGVGAHFGDGGPWWTQDFGY
ncbi:CAP domain-containing protein [Streptomyces sp. WAC 00631]|uniref:CAP domain-containing protein n=1 Tax=Streptomyces sp. WAC 00631 TaxID=2203201 RepID=UPI000F770DA7|nr:CAP domain-containing protein [Streptomyces sp. WAC 00631]MCC5035750.1 CAP domain-containing protein [Streptomyces sp. WAC 00631]